VIKEEALNSEAMQGTILDLENLTPMDILEFYDRPIFYSCLDDDNNIFLVILIDDLDGYDSWLYVCISKARYIQLIDNKISVASALGDPENDCAFIVENSKNGFIHKRIPASQIDKEWLPSADFYLNHNEINPVLINKETA